MAAARRVHAVRLRAAAAPGAVPSAVQALAGAVHAALRRRRRCPHGGVPRRALMFSRSWALDAIFIIVAVVLLLAGFLGRRDGRGYASEEPLLIGARGNR
jgi:hypothetical protein